jgi:P27 family predicted phage terminase small subunit
MPTPLKRSENMTGHLTKNQISARKRAEAGLQTGKRAYLRAPSWLSEDARQVFGETKRRLKEYELLEAADIDLLAMYADMVVRYREGVKRLSAESEPKEITAVQAWGRMAMTYADKLGFSQTARARLARRRAQETPPDDMEQLLDDVSEYLNGGRG